VDFFECAEQVLLTNAKEQARILGRAANGRRA
jgi:hypothetical protein